LWRFKTSGLGDPSKSLDRIWKEEKEKRKEEKLREENAGESERGKGKEPRSGHWLRQYEAESGDRREWFGGRERGRPPREW